MRTFQATIRDGDKTLAEDVTVYLEETTTANGLKTWYGVFRLAEAWDFVEAGGPYRITLDDGRSGDVIINNVSMSSHAPTQVSFVGTGPLQ